MGGQQGRHADEASQGVLFSEFRQLIHSKSVCPPMGLARSIAASTARLAAEPFGSTRHRFMMLRYSPANAAALRCLHLTGVNDN